MKKLLPLSLLPLILLACLSTLGFEPPPDPAPTEPAMSPSMVAPSPQAVRSNCATVNTDSLHIRYQPSEHAQAVGWVTEGTTIKILVPGAWPKITGAGIDDQGHRTRLTGYVNSNYLTETECTNANQ